jgi:ubiquinone/menaquinone biosynthesis C-methylase UbiE
MITKHSNSPEVYDLHNHLQVSFAKNILSKIPFEEKSKILDIGCGDGKITMEIAKTRKSGFVIGTDVSDNMIEFSTNKYKHQPNLIFFNHGCN